MTRWGGDYVRPHIGNADNPRQMTHPRRYVMFPRSRLRQYVQRLLQRFQRRKHPAPHTMDRAGQSPYNEWDYACDGEVITWETYLSETTRNALLQLHARECLDTWLEAFWQWEPTQSLRERLSYFPLRMDIYLLHCAGFSRFLRMVATQRATDQGFRQSGPSVQRDRIRSYQERCRPLLDDGTIGNCFSPVPRGSSLAGQSEALAARGLCCRAVLPNTPLQLRGTTATWTLPSAPLPTATDNLLYRTRFATTIPIWNSLREKRLSSNIRPQ